MKPIRLTEAMIAEMKTEFASVISKCKMTDGRISFMKSFAISHPENIRKPVLYFTPTAMAKQKWLIEHFTTEAAWNGIVSRTDDGDFIISDILVGPQVVSGARVTVDDQSFNEWLMTVDDEAFNHMHYQAHSHVNMSTVPSGVDMANQQEILSQLSENDFYIFCIFNKKGEFSARLYDMSSNRVYEDRDVEIHILGEEDISDFCKDALSKIKTANEASVNAKDNVFLKTKSLAADTPAAKSSPKTKTRSKGKPITDENIDYDSFIFGDSYYDWR